MSVFRYINNSDKDIISGAYLVPAYDQLMFSESQPVLDALVGKTLVGLVDGVEVESAKPVEVEKPSKQTEPVVSTKA